MEINDLGIGFIIIIGSGIFIFIINQLIDWYLNKDELDNKE